MAKRSVIQKKKKKLYKDSLQFCTISLTPTFTPTILFLHKTLQLMMMYHPIKSG